MKRAAFLDRDGVINLDRDYVHRQEDFVFVPGVLEAARKLHELGFALVVITNQSGIGRGLYTEAQFLQLTEWMREQFKAAGAPLAGVYYCPHHPTEALDPYRIVCDCRKPAPGLFLRAARELGIDLSASVMFGDRASDLDAARGAGVPLLVLLGTDAAHAPAQADVQSASAAHAGLRDAVEDPVLLRQLELGNAVAR
jgi:D-glycero-D-manno-heptose 1,7-bisphosphate phosphatase